VNVEIPPEVALSLLQRLREERRSLTAQLAEHEARCTTSGPHGYITCQIQYQKIATALERIDAEIATLTTALRERLH